MYPLFLIPVIRCTVFYFLHNITNGQIQAFAGLATVLVSIIVLIQNRKIGTLKEITSELAKQAESTSALYQLSLRDLAMRYAPRLSESSWDHANSRYEAKLIGNSAFFTEIKAIKSKGVSVTSSSLNMQKRLSNSLFFSIDGGDELSVTGFAEFYIYYRSPLNLTYKQYFIIRKQPNYKGVSGTPKFIITFDYVTLLEQEP